MISLPLLKKEIKSNWKILTILLFVLCFYLIVIIAMFDPKLAELLDGFTTTMPELMSAFGMGAPGTNLTSFTISYFYGLFAIVFPLIFIIAMSSRLLSKYIDTGSMAYLLATPNSRIKILFTQFVFIWLSLIVMVGVLCGAGIIVSEMLFPGNLEIGKFIIMNLDVLALQFCISGICFFIATLVKDPRKARTLTIAIPVGFYIFQMVANLGGNMEFMKYFTLYTLYQPSGIVAGSSSAYLGMLALVLIGLGLYILSVYIFNKRDLNV